MKVKTEKKKKSIEQMTKDELIQKIKKSKKVKNELINSLEHSEQIHYFERKMNEMLSKSNIKAGELREDYIDAFKHSRKMEEKRLELKSQKNKMKMITVEAIGGVFGQVLELIIKEIKPNEQAEPKFVNTIPNPGPKK